MSESGPLRDGSIFPVFNLHHGLDPGAALAELSHQARRAIDLGFDGVGLSEHHAGAAGYLPVPLLAGATLLAELPRGFFAALPIILPLRSVAGLVEEAAWLEARFPGRVVIGLAAGYQEDDFAAFGVPFAERFRRFRAMFEEVAAALSGGAPAATLRNDPAVAAAAGRVGLVMTTRGHRNAQLAGRIGAGITPTQLSLEEYRELFGLYREAGGPGPTVVQRWVFLGDPPLDAIASFNRAIAAAPGDVSWFTEASRIVPLDDRSPERMAERLVDWLRATGGTALCVRFHIGPLEPAVVREQIERFGAEVLPGLRERMAAYLAERERAEASAR
jgi:alkanesulfonate monooxygenase SsuD/methylene tetrahydromethanopterin reductase-like flavin-dependent oxidoreductase (luciferase family)